MISYTALPLTLNGEYLARGAEAYLLFLADYRDSRQ